MEHLSILLIVIPLLFAPITALVPKASLAWGMSLLVTLFNLVLSICLLVGASQGDVIHYELGGWAPPWGIEYILDSLNLWLCFIVNLLAFITLVYAKRSVEHEIPAHQISLFYAAFQLCLLGLLGIAMTGDLFNLFVFLEISSLATYSLIAMGKKRQALTSAFNYLIVGTLGATFFLIGVGLLFAATGTLNMANIAERIPLVESTQLVRTSYVFIILGLALKAAIYPMHLWLPNAYAYAPSVISVFLSASATKVAIYAILRTIFDVFPLNYALEILIPQAFLAAGCIAVLYGSWRATSQQSMKKIFAYSSVAQIGYMVMGIGLLSQSGLTATLLHLFNHALIKACLFMCAGLFIYRLHSDKLSEVKGMGKRMPWTFAALTIAALSLIGVPGTAGFISKWQLLQAGLAQENWSVVIVVLLGSLMAISYMWKIIEALYFQSADKPHVAGVEPGESNVSRSPRSMSVAMWALALMCIYFGMQSHFPMDAASQAASQLLQAKG